jgi:mannose-6-phosphate isomerase-like protein (cupin superfamily)
MAVVTPAKKLNLIDDVVDNFHYRRVLDTAIGQQYVAMALSKGQMLATEVHQNSDQSFMVVSGHILMTIGQSQFDMGPNDMIMVKRGMPHSVKSISEQYSKLLTIYSPPVHKYDVLQPTAEKHPSQQAVNQVLEMETSARATRKQITPTRVDARCCGHRTKSCSTSSSDGDKSSRPVKPEKRRISSSSGSSSSSGASSSSD